MKYSKCLAFLVVICLTTLFSYAGSGGPDAFGYSWIDSAEVGGPDYSWVDIASADNQISAEPVATIDLETPVVFYGEVETQLRVSQHGYLSTLLSDNGKDNTFDCPLPATPDIGGGNRIYPLHGNYRDGGTVHYKYIPRAAHPSNRCGAHVISWSKMINEDLDTRPVEFQVLLFDNFDILFQINTDGISSGQASTTGILHSGNTEFLSIACNTPGSIPDDYAVLISPKVIQVTSNADTLGAGGGTTLRDALGTVSDGQRIELAAIAGNSITLSHADALLASKSVAIVNSDAGFLSITGAGRVGLLVFDAFQNNHCFLSGIDFSNCGDRGINCTESMTLFECELISNQSADKGGGIFSSGDLFLTNCRIAGNVSNGERGGGIFANSSLTARGCLFSNNDTTGGGNTDGGCIHAPSSGETSTFVDCNFSNNDSADHGGAIWAGAGHSVILDDCFFGSNDATSATGRGGAVALADADLTATRCYFYQNDGGFRGGGIYATGDPLIEIAHSSFDGNNATTGSAIAAQGGELRLAHCTVVRNTGIALSLTASFHTFFCGNSLFEDNDDGSGGEIAIAINSATVLSGGPNLSDADEVPFSAALGDIENTEANIITNALGGRLSLGSPAINAGSGFDEPSDLDLRGVPRVQGSQIDIGAFEYHAQVIVDTVADENPSPGDTSLRMALDWVGSHGTISFANNLSGETITYNGNLFPDVAVNIDGSNLDERVTIEGGASLYLFDGASVEGVNFDGFTRNPFTVFGEVTISDCEVTNSAGIMAANENLTGGPQTIRIERCRFSDNGPHPFGSHEFSIGGDNTFILEDSVIENTESSTDGGAIYFLGRVVATILNSSIVRNTTPGDGGALYFASGGSGNVKITNSTISSNEATGSYGSLYGDNIDLEIYRCTIAANRCSSGDSIRLEGRSTGEIGQSIFQGNSEGFNVANFGNLITSNGWNIVDNDDLSTPLSTDMINRKAHIAPLGYYSPDSDYLMPVHSLFSFSPAIDAGQTVTGDPAFDNRRAPRIADGDGDGSATIDIGAFEAMAPVFVTVGLDSGAGTLRQSILNAPPGGRVLFDPSLDGTQLFLNSQIEIPHTVQIDATSLPNGYIVNGNNQTRLMWMDTSSHLAVHALTLRNGETGTGAGGGAFHQKKGHSIFSNCALIFNQGEDGVGAYIDEGSCYLLNCTIANNVGSGLGAALNFRPASTGRIEHCSITRNTSGSRGNVVLSNADVTGKYTLFAENRVNSLLDTFSWDTGYDPSTFSLGNNVADENMPSSFLNDPTDNDNNPALPIEAARYNGGWCATVAVSEAPIIDSASVNDSPPYPTFDARGFIRRGSKFTRIDAGAFEAEGDTQDSDGDQMPDWWECRFGLVVFSTNTLEGGQDPDEDDFTNLEEFQNSTDPLMAEQLAFALPRMLALSPLDPPGNGFRFLVHGSVRTQALLEFSTDLENWSDNGQLIEFTGVPQNLGITANSGDERFFIRFSIPE